MARDTVEIIAEEMRRLDPDEVYARGRSESAGPQGRRSPREPARGAGPP